MNESPRARHRYGRAIRHWLLRHASAVRGLRDLATWRTFRMSDDRTAPTLNWEQAHPCASCRRGADLQTKCSVVSGRMRRQAKGIATAAIVRLLDMDRAAAIA